MHELSVIRSILDIVVEHAQKHGAHKVRTIQVEVGMLSDLEEEWMQRYFDYLNKDTIAQDAKLVIKWIPIVFKCQKCNKSFEVNRTRLDDISCPSCGQYKLSLISGREYLIKNMEVE